MYFFISFFFQDSSQPLFENFDCDPLLLLVDYFSKPQFLYVCAEFSSFLPWKISDHSSKFRDATYFPMNRTFVNCISIKKKRKNFSSNPATIQFYSKKKIQICQYYSISIICSWQNLSSLKNKAFPIFISNSWGMYVWKLKFIKTNFEYKKFYNKLEILEHLFNVSKLSMLQCCIFKNSLYDFKFDFISKQKFL